MVKDLQVSDEAFNRLTRLTTVMTNALDRAVELEINLSEEPVKEVKGIVFLSDDKESGIQLFGYEDTGAGLADLLVHMKAMFASMGKSFGVMTDQGVMLLEEE